MTGATFDDADVVDVQGEDITYRLVLPQRTTDAIQKHVANTGEPYEREMLRAVAERIVPETRVLDIGANVGNHSIYWATHVDCTVIAYEPNESLGDALQASAEINGVADRVMLRRVGVGSRRGRARFRESIPTNLGAQSLIENVDGEIELVAIDDDLDTSVRVSVIKIDIEGMEIEALEGARGVITRDAPTLFVECAELVHFDAVSAMLAELGYGVVATYNATPTHEFRPSGPEGAATAAEVARYVRAAYADAAVISETRSRLAAANDKYRSVTETLSHSRQQAGDAARAHAAETADLARRARSAESGLERVRSEALRASAERDALRGRVSSMQARLSAEQTKANRLAAQMERARAIVAAKNREIRRLQKRKVLRAANKIAAARREFARVARGIVGRRGPRHATPIVDVAGAPVTPQPAAPFVPTTVVDPTTDVRFQKEHLDSRASAADRARHRFAASRGERTPRIAAIVDDFTANGFAPETDMVNLERGAWESQISEFEPDLLFVESAWRGAGGSWHNALPGVPDEVRALLAWCVERDIPTVFWNKEDPVHFETFLPLSAEFDFVATTDLDRVPLYMRELGHDRVFFLPFASQPRIHHPIQTRPRKRALMFAGGYYRRYPERMRDLAAAIEGSAAVLPIEIFDRQYGTTLADYAFPNELQRYIVGTLAASDIDEAYKGYDFALNLNSVKDSTTMFARRVMELTTSGTATVSNYARGLRVMFADLIPSSDSASGIRERLSRLAEDPLYRDRLRTLALRKSLREHTYQERVRLLSAVIAGEAYSPARRRCTVILAPETAAGWERLSAAVDRQQNVDVRVVVVTDDTAVRTEAAGRGWNTVGTDEASQLTVATVAEGLPVAVLDDNDGYGPGYLESLLCATAYTEAALLIKRDRFVADEDDSVRRVQDGEHFREGSTDRPEARRALLCAGAYGQASLQDLLGGTMTTGDLPSVSVDPFDYCENGATAPLDEFSAASPTIDEGSSMQDLWELAARYSERAERVPGPPHVAVGDLPRSAPASSGFAVVRRGYGTLHIHRFEEGDPVTLWCAGRLDLPAHVEDGHLPVHLETTGTLRTSAVIRWYDARGTVLGADGLTGNRDHRVAVPAGAATAQLGIRVAGVGTVDVRQWALGHLGESVRLSPPKNDTLLIADAYPSYDDLYRYGFVHSRVVAYRARGLDVDVFRYQRSGGATRYEFEDVEVESGPADALSARLRSGQHRRVLVHFLNAELWGLLEPFASEVDITVWVHGVEIQPWWRRPHADEQARQRAEAQTEEKLAFWRRLADDLPPRMTLVFVSEAFRSQVEEDLGRRFPPEQTAIIHNPIDTDTFEYVEKTAADRLAVLSIRPYVGPVYANDLAVEAVRRLSAEPWFGEMTFHFAGDGPLFDTTLAPIRDLPNVIVEKGYLRRSEIAALHRRNGVFLVPTRADTHGVSRDEAMSSGLVPVTSAVGAVPEFVSTEEGYLAPLDDVDAIVAALRDIHADPAGFLRRSRAAGARVRSQAAADRMLPREIAVITRTESPSDPGTGGK